MHSIIPRRTFLRQAAAGSAGLFLSRICVDAARQLSPNEKLNLAVIGVAHQGGSDMSQLESENIVALCDVDETYLAAAAQKHPGAKTYHDFRRLLEQRDIDAVLVATPDHTHAVATVAALKSGRHVYCEKPLTRTVSECRAVMEAARKSRLVTQIGTQIHGGTNYRRVVELVRSGAIGPVREVHVWVDATYGRKLTPTAGVPLPAHLHFDLWLGPVAERPYSPDYVPRDWRNWWAFGGGALADFGCHFMDLPHWALELTAPSSVEIVESPPVQAESVPPWLVVQYQYAARGKNPAVALTWYHGGRQPKPEVLQSKLAGAWRSGVLFVGAKGQLLADYGRHQLLPQAQFEGFVPPTPFIPDSIGHYREWAQACKTGGPTTCNFEYSGTLTEAVLLGNVAYRAGRKLQWNSKKLRATDCPEANQFIQHQYRAGWKL
jgi:predicted dehydrogenase